VKLQRVIQDSDTPASRTFELVVLSLVGFSIITLSVETLPGLPAAVQDLLNVSEVAITVLFTIEYVLRVATSPDRRRYIFSFYGFVDLVAILPFYLSLGLDLRALRAFRLFRIFRIFKVTRYSVAVERFGRALSDAKAEALVFLLATLIVLYLSAVGIYYFENDAQPEAFQSVFHSLWWAVATLLSTYFAAMTIFVLRERGCEEVAALLARTAAQKQPIQKRLQAEAMTKRMALRSLVPLQSTALLYGSMAFQVINVALPWVQYSSQN